MGRFYVGEMADDSFVVLGIPREEYARLGSAERAQERLVVIRPGGAISPELALTWCEQIAQQLNERDTATVVAARLVG